jgi:hypothetical protein
MFRIDQAKTPKYCRQSRPLLPVLTHLVVSGVVPLLLPQPRFPLPIGPVVARPVKPRIVMSLSRRSSEAHKGRLPVRINLALSKCTKVHSCSNQTIFIKYRVNRPEKTTRGRYLYRLYQAKLSRNII